jgi:hypothetical protein
VDEIDTLEDRNYGRDYLQDERREQDVQISGFNFYLLREAQQRDQRSGDKDPDEGVKEDIFQHSTILKISRWKCPQHRANA